jgi:hypothetical protein
LSATFFQDGQALDDELPDDGGRNSSVIMSQDVADAGDLSPRDMWVPRFELVGKMAARLRNHLKTTLHEPLASPITLESLERKVAKNS